MGAEVKNMTRPLRITEIDEFAETGRIPKAAITEEIIANVAKLDEKTQLEVWIQEIIHSHDETPHGPTEIADIIATISVGGKPTCTAFVLKGKGTQRVSSRLVAHQFLKLNQLTELELIVLVAVGDIQDDARRDFQSTAKAIGCNHIIISNSVLARLLIAYDKICGQDGLPFANEVCPNGHSQRGEIVLNYKVSEDAKWEILKLRDLSHGLAKRLAATVLTDRHYPDDILRTIIVEVFQKVRTDPFLRSEMAHARWSNTPAHVVWIDIGFDIEDINRCNWICMACWIDPELDERFRPHWSNYDEVHDGIMIDWKSDYHAMKRLYSEHTGNKHEVIQCVEEISKELQPILELFGAYLCKIPDGCNCRATTDRGDPEVRRPC